MYTGRLRTLGVTADVKASFLARLATAHANFALLHVWVDHFWCRLQRIMGNAHTHDRRKSGAPETGLTIEGIREKPLPQHERKQGRVEKKVCTEVYVLISSKIISFCLTGLATQLPYIRGRNKRGSGNWKYSRRNPAITQTITGQYEINLHCNLIHSLMN